MEKIKSLTCKACQAKLTIMENSFFDSELKKNEKAFCPNCKSEVYEGQTDGWYYVEIVDNQRKTTQQCIYPMP